MAKDEFACLPAVVEMELNGLYLHPEKWEALGQELKQQQAVLLAELNASLQRPSTQQISLLPEFTETINPRSPLQVKAALQAQNIPISSTHAQDLIPLIPDYPVIQTLLNYRSLSTRISTFTEGLPNHIHPVTGHIHPNWFQIGARSGRFRCCHPNLQNIPRDKTTRSCFTAAEGHVLIKADYSQIELRIMAKVSGDLRMKQAYCRGKDLHRLTASFVFWKGVGEVTDEERRLGKIINFGLIYGMGARKFRSTAAKDYGVQMTMAEASAFRRTFFASYQGIQRYHTQVRRQWQRGGRVSRTPDGRRRVWPNKNQPKLNEMINHPIQGANATITKRALACFARRGLVEARLVAVVHDEILVECPREREQEVARVLEDCIVQAGESVLMPIPCVVDVGVLKSWGG